MQALDDWSRVGDRVRMARVASGMSQSELADVIRVDRSAVGRIEKGERRLSLLEAAAMADQLAVDLSMLLGEMGAAATSYRRSPAEGSARERQRARAAIVLEQHAGDTAWLVEHGHLAIGDSRHGRDPRPQARLDVDGVERAARSARVHAGLGPTEPVGPLTDLGEALGIFLISVDDDIEGASVDAGSWSVAVVSSRLQPGRRRMTAAHEIGHQVMGDEYSVDLGVSASTDERERAIDRFAAELLLPGEVVSARLSAASDDAAVADGLVHLAAMYRVSWRAAVQRAVDAGAVPPAQGTRLANQSPTRGDLIRVFGREVPADLEPGSAGPRWIAAVLEAYVSGDLGQQRALRMLGGRFVREQLPQRPDDDLW